jgi:hypothetical protein
MPERRSAERLKVDRLAALCRELDEAIREAAKGRASSAEALAALHVAKEKSSELCGAVGRLSLSVSLPARARKAVRKKG